MENSDPFMAELVLAEREGRDDDVLRMLAGRFDEIERGEGAGRASLCITMFSWEQLAERHAPARAALMRARDAQAARLRAGDWDFGSQAALRRPARFEIVAGMNDTLDDVGATHALFADLLALDPQRARSHAWRALPAIVAVGDVALAARFLPDPLRWLDDLNETARLHPLFPDHGKAPRLMADLSNFARELKLRSAILRGLRRDAEAQESVDAGLAGLATDEMRALARQELDSHGAIIRAITEHQMALDAAASGDAPQT